VNRPFGNLFRVQVHNAESALKVSAAISARPQIGHAIGCGDEGRVFLKLTDQCSVGIHVGIKPDTAEGVFRTPGFTGGEFIALSGSYGLGQSHKSYDISGPIHNLGFVHSYFWIFRSFLLIT
jgi:hypothetical protein